MPAVLALLPVAYLLGTFPSAVIVARAKGIDITKVGSGNPGASNIARTVGTKWGVAVFLLDGLKGALPAVTGLLLDERGGAYALVAAAVLGHMFPVTRRFQGGKGVATSGGGMLVLQPLPALVMLPIWFAVRTFGRIASLASLTLAVGFPVAVAVFGAPAWELLAIVGLCLMVMVRHVDNIRRLLRHSELSARGEPRLPRSGQ